MMACAGGHKELVEVLIEANATVDIQDKVRGGG